MKHIRLVDSSDKIIIDNLASECKKCFNECNTIGKLIEKCPKYGEIRRFGKVENNNCSTFLCCNKTKTTKLFREKVEALSYAFPELNMPVQEIEEKIQKNEQLKVNRLVHNLTSINAFNIQEIYDLVPQSVLALNWKNQIEYIEKEIISNPKNAAMMYLRIAKNTIHMKSEFSIYRKLDRGDSASLDKQNHHIRNVLLNVLHTFFSDFSSKGIYINVAEHYEILNFDYETIQVAFYHLIENSLKYAKPDSKIEITFKQNKGYTQIEFSMISTFISNNERENIFKEGISGEVAKKMKKNGDGIGMWRIRQMMEINEGEFFALFGDEIEKCFGFEYTYNTFVLKFKNSL